MSMDHKKPLIFFEPMSETLKKLYEVIEPNAEEEGIEIYLVEDIGEMAQLIPTIGQALILASSPKKCAMMMQQNRKAIKKIQTKVILLSPKAIPRKILEKFMKLGLTECVVEPVNPKTLLYKVRLFLRSIVTKKESAGFNDKTDINSDGNNQKEEGVSHRRFKKDQQEESGESENKKEKKNHEEVTMEDYSKSMRKEKHEEDPIDNYYRGDMKKKNEGGYEEEEQEKKKSGYSEEAIDTNYKGDINAAEELDIEEENLNANLPTLGDREKDELEELRKNMALEVEEDLEKSKEGGYVEEAIDGHMKGQLSGENLDIEEDEKEKDGEGSVDEIEQYMRGKNSTQSIDLEEEDENNSDINSEKEDLGGHLKGKLSQGLDIEEDEKEKEIKTEDESTEAYKRKKKTSLDLEDDEDIYDREKRDAEEKEKKEKERKAALELLDEMEEYKRQKNQGLVEEEKEDRKKDAKADEIDGYMRGGTSKEKLDLDDDEDIYERAKREEKERAKREKSIQIDLLEEEKEKEEKEQKEKAAAEAREKKAEKLAIVEDEDPSKSEKGVLEDEQERERKKSDFQENDLGNMKGKGGETENIEDGYNKSNNKAEHIQTHYSSKESVKHDEDYDWDVAWEKQQKEEEEDNKNQEAKELIFEKEDLGEQTINYKELKNQFDGITIDREGEKKKKEYPEFSETAEAKTFTKTVLNENLEEVEMEFEDVQIEEELEEPEQKVYEPKPVGIDISIRTLSLYMNNETTLEEVNKFVGRSIYETFQGKTVFYKKNYEDQKNGEYLLIQNGFINPTLDENNNSAKEAELKEDWKEIVDEYYGKWLDAKLPTWSDETFQEQDIQFVFPYFEAGECIGFGVVLFEDGFNQDLCASVEMVMEVCRGVFLQELHLAKGEERTIGKKKAASKEKKKKKGFFGSLIDKIAG